MKCSNQKLNYQTTTNCICGKNNGSSKFQLTTLQVIDADVNGRNKQTRVLPTSTERAPDTKSINVNSHHTRNHTVCQKKYTYKTIHAQVYTHTHTHTHAHRGIRPQLPRSFQAFKSFVKQFFTRNGSRTVEGLSLQTSTLMAAINNYTI